MKNKEEQEKKKEWLVITNGFALATIIWSVGFWVLLIWK